MSEFQTPPSVSMPAAASPTRLSTPPSKDLAIWRPDPALPPRRSPTRTIQASPGIGGSVGNQRTGRAEFRQQPGRHCALGRQDRRLRHKSARICGSASRQAAACYRHEPFEGCPRQSQCRGAKGEAIPEGWAVDKDGKPTTIHRQLSMAQCSRWAMRRARSLS